MGLGKMLTRSTVYTVQDTEAGTTQTFTVIDNLGPSWPTSQPTYRGGMSVPGAWRAANLVADLLGQVPWDAFRRRAGTRRLELIDPTPPLIEQPYPPDSRMDTISAWALDYIWEGNAVGIVAARNAEAWPTAVVPVDAANVAVRRVNGVREYRIGDRVYDATDVLHIKGPHKPGADRGMGVLEAHLNTLDLATVQNQQARKISRHGVPTGVIKVENPDLTSAEATKIKGDWATAQADGGVAVLNPVTDFQPISWNPEEMQLVEARRFTLTELELIFGLPPGWLGGMNSARQYSNIEQDAINLLKFTLGGPLARFEQEFSRHFPRGTYVRANLDAILRADTLSRYQAYAIGLDKGFITLDEVRDEENRPPLPEPTTPPPPPPPGGASNEGE